MTLATRTGIGYPGDAVLVMEIPPRGFPDHCPPMCEGWNRTSPRRVSGCSRKNGSLLVDHSTVYRQGMARHKGSGIGAQPHHDFCNLLHRPSTSHGMQSRDSLRDLRIAEKESFGHLCLDHSRTDGVHANTLGWHTPVPLPWSGQSHRACWHSRALLNGLRLSRSPKTY